MGFECGHVTEKKERSDCPLRDLSRPVVLLSTTYLLYDSGNITRTQEQESNLRPIGKPDALPLSYPGR